MMEPIAIVGMSCRFPGANHPEALWKLLNEKGDAITEVPRERWDVGAYYTEPPAAPGKMCTRWGGFIEHVDQFDAAFFGISTREASFMDPQQRMVLEVTWEALEHAGVAATGLAGSNTGVFIGVSNYDYNRLLCRDPATMDAYSSTGTILAITANRISYLLNLRGPSIALDTACSSSLVSVHLACQSLRLGESDLALAGGVNLILSPEVTIILSQGGLMSPDGRCKAFDAGANGYVRSEGCGMLVLKRLSDAQRDGNNILALIRGSAVNQDGSTNGMTAPSAVAQQAVIRQALANAGVRPGQLSYVEAHGSGTRLGDIIETRALRAVLLEDRPADYACAIGSIKTNIGHTESAAGIAGLIKVVLSLQHNTIPANLHLNKINPYIRFDTTPLFIPSGPQPWPSGTGQRLAGVSSFGIGGTNAHVIIDEPPEQPPAVDSPPRRRHLLPISAKTASGLGAMIRSYQSFLSAQDEVSLGDLCFTASHGRSHFPHRAALSCDSVEELRERLDALSGPVAAEELCPRRANGQAPSVAFLFTGQGAESAGFGRQLYETETSFREALERCDALLGGRFRPLASFLDPDFASLLEGDAASASVFSFAFQYALAELWRSWGIKPAAVLGFGVGEVVATCVAGVLAVGEALKIVEEFGRGADNVTRPAEPAPVTADYAPPRLNLISPLTGDIVAAGAVLSAEYRPRPSPGEIEPVTAFDGLRRLGIDILLEMGPRTDIGELGAECLSDNSGALLNSSSKDRDDTAQMFESLGEMYQRGVEVDWLAFHHGRGAHRLTPLPTYAFERKRFWIDTA